MDGWMHGWMDGWMDGRTDGCMDGSIDSKHLYDGVLKQSAPAPMPADPISRLTQNPKWLFFFPHISFDQPLVPVAFASTLLCHEDPDVAVRGPEADGDHPRCTEVLRVCQGAAINKV